MAHPTGPAIDPNHARVHLVGGGIAGLAAAAFLIRDGDVPGHHITIYEELDRLGGSLDGSGTPEAGYVLRGGRMLESKFRCTYGLFASIPTLDGGRTVTQEIVARNEIMKSSSKARLVRNGARQTAPAFGLSETQILTLAGLALAPEGLLRGRRIADQFDADFFTTGFWVMWCTTFAFQPWHSALEFKRYLVRFVHLVPGFNRLEGIMRTTYNQFDSLVAPLQTWLRERGVHFELNTRVTDLRMAEQGGGMSVTRIVCRTDANAHEVAIDAGDCVVVTLGSMTEASSLGGMDAAAVPRGKADGGAWRLWERIAEGRPAFGRPSVFADHVDKSRWLSFTATLRDPTLLRRVRDLTGNVPGEGGLVTFPDSRWLASIVIPFQPHFVGQPDDVAVLWGYGLSVDAPGDFVGKPMVACTGREIMTEILGHLHVEAGAEANAILANCICIPCLMPFITSQFLPRAKGDRPAVRPAGTRNLAFIGQFCELPHDVVFTVEYSVRSAQEAAYSLLGLSRRPPPVYRGWHDPRVLWRAVKALHDWRF